MSAAAIGGASPAVQQTATNQFAEIQTADFINILIAEMANQDPFEPQDSAAILEQLSSLRNIESQLVLQDKLETLVLQNQITAASGMIGRLVSGLDEANNRVAGLVTAVSVREGEAVLELDTGHTLAIDRVTRIDALDVIEAAGAPAGGAN